MCVRACLGERVVSAGSQAFVRGREGVGVGGSQASHLHEPIIHARLVVLRQLSVAEAMFRDQIPGFRIRSRVQGSVVSYSSAQDSLSLSLSLSL